MMNSLKDQIKLLQKPRADELEVTTIGVGGFEGEAIVVHFGNGEWGIIDSCKSQEGENLPLFYLDTLGVPYDDVKVIVCTHWHSDHINGLSEIISNCKKADFFFPVVGQKNNLIKYLVEGDKAQGLSSVWSEFVKCINTADKLKTGFAMTNTTVYDNGHGVAMVALSPSDRMLVEMERILVDFDAKGGELKNINENVIKPNMCCTALLLYTPDTCILLGADLEANRNKRKSITSCVGSCSQRWEKGWCNAVIKSTSLRVRKASLFKLPHHSSKTGYCPEIWSNHVENKPVSVSTVFINNAGIKLPKKNMLVFYRNQSSELFLTSSGPKKKEKKAGKGRSKLDDNKSDQLKSIAVMSEEKGIICSRKKNGQAWETQLLGTALSVTDSFINQYQDN